MSKTAHQMLTRRYMLGASLATVGASLALPVLASGRVAKDRATNVAIRGYDTTAYFLKSTAEIGSELYPVSWNGAVWRFATRAEADMFAANPDQFAPQFGGYCTRALSFKKLVPADPEVWRIHGDKLYMFARPVGGTYFDKGPDAMIAKAVEYWASL